MTMNTVYSIKEYMAQGFTKEEAPKVKRSDILFNKRAFWTEEEAKEYYSLVEELGL